MRLQEQIKKDLVTAMKAKDEEKKNVLRVIMGEFSRQAQKEISDEEIQRIIKKLIKSEREVLDKSNASETNHFIEVAESYLPKMIAEEDIKAWIKANINFSDYKNKMQAMRPIMAHFGANAEGNLVKKILGEL